MFRRYGPLGNDSSLDLSVAAVGEVPQHVWQLRQRLLVIHHVARVDDALRNQFERAADVRGSVMETRLAGDLGVVQQIGIDADFSAGRAASKEVDDTALANQFGGHLPGFGATDGLYHHIGAAARCFSLHFGYEGVLFAELNAFVRAEIKRALYLFHAAGDGNHARPVSEPGEPHEHQAKGSQAKDSNAVTGTNVTLIQAAQGAR